MSTLELEWAQMVNKKSCATQEIDKIASTFGVAFTRLILQRTEIANLCKFVPKDIELVPILVSHFNQPAIQADE